MCRHETKGFPALTFTISNASPLTRPPGINTLPASTPAHLFIYLAPPQIEPVRDGLFANIMYHPNDRFYLLSIYAIWNKQLASWSNVADCTIVAYF